MDTFCLWVPSELLARFGYAEVMRSLRWELDCISDDYGRLFLRDCIDASMSDVRGDWLGQRTRLIQSWERGELTIATWS